MLSTFTYVHLLYLALAVILDVVANVFMKLSKGWQNKFYGVAAILCVLAAFTSLSFAIRGIQLSVAYGIWGGLGLIATALFGIVLFKERIRPLGWLGMLLVIAGVLLMKMSHLF
jgi:spermidine export protein MdtI